VQWVKNNIWTIEAELKRCYSGTGIDNLIFKNAISKDSSILFVNDGSKDRTWRIIEEFNQTNHYVKGLKLSKNVGHQNTLSAGLNTVISIDADLQDDINVIEEFIQNYSEGYEIVYGVRRQRKTDTFFKRNTAQAFYRIMD
jgi:glycosyltransferase involved in cell wall biosynthesis